MQFKKVTFSILMGIMMLFGSLAIAQQDATIDPSAIRYWIGEGENEAVFIVNWNEPDTALAWGYRFSGDYVIVKDLMEEIAATDTRFSYEAMGGMVDDIFFHDENVDLQLAGRWWYYLVNGTMAEGYSTQRVYDGDYVKWGDESCGVDLGNYEMIWTTEIVPVYPLASDATIDPNEVAYWVGEGAHKVVFIVNWNNPNKALAWGYRFDADNVFVKDVMDAIAAADARFSYESAGTLVTDLKYDDGSLSLSLSGMYWLMLVNGGMAWYGYEEQTVVDGDYVKWGDESCSTEIAQWTYVWEQEVEPVSIYTKVDENHNLAMSLYPNPAVSELWLMVAHSGALSVSVADLSGRIVSQREIVAVGNEAVRLDVNDLQSGVYFVTVRGEAGNQTLRLVVR